MKPLARILLLAGLLVPITMAASQAEADIKAVLNAQVGAWNRGDIPTFVNSYADDCIFVGKQVAQGKAQLLARYQKAYPTPEAMGHLAFNDVAVRLLDKDVAIVTAQWHLDRSSAGGGPVGGLFSLVLERKAGAWKIVLDHTA